LVVEGGEFVVRGTARGPSGARLPAAEVDAQLHSPGGRFSQGSSGGQFLSAQGGDLGGVITYDAPGSAHWTARWPALGAADSAFALAGASKVTAGTFHGAPRTITKDTVAPGAPTASVPAGSYGSAQSVELAAETGASIRYTTDGSDPTAASPAYPGPVRVTASQTLKAIAIDPAGNASPVAAFAYAITPASAPATAALPRLHLEALQVRSRLTLRAAHRRGIRVTLYAPEGATVVRVR